MSPLKDPARIAAFVAVTAGLTVAGTVSANAATVPPPTVAANTVSAEVLDPVPNSAWPPRVGQTCSGALVPLHAIPGLVGPVLGGDILDILTTLLSDDTVTPLHLPASPALIATLPGVPGTLLANNVSDDFYATAVICNGGNVPLEPHLFLTQVGNPLGAFEGSVTGSTSDWGSSEGRSIGLGSAGVDVGSVDGMLELGSISGSAGSAGSEQGSVTDIGFEGSIADVTDGSVALGVGVGSSGSAAGSATARGSIESQSMTGIDLDLGSLASSDGSNDGSSIDAGSALDAADGIGTIDGSSIS